MKNNFNKANVPAWFSKLWNGTLFGKKKDTLILQILKLGGKNLLISRCRLRLDRNTIKVGPPPSIKQLLSVLRALELERSKITKMMVKGELIIEHPQDYSVKRNVIINRNELYCDSEIWIRNK